MIEKKVKVLLQEVVSCSEDAYRVVRVRKVWLRYAIERFDTRRSSTNLSVKVISNDTRSFELYLRHHRIALLQIVRHRPPTSPAQEDKLVSRYLKMTNGSHILQLARTKLDSQCLGKDSYLLF